jgi:hypothetical protein
MRLVGMWHAKMRQRGPVVQSDIWRCWCVHVLVCKAVRTIEGYSELSHKGEDMCEDKMARQPSACLGEKIKLDV